MLNTHLAQENHAPLIRFTRQVLYFGSIEKEEALINHMFKESALKRQFNQIDEFIPLTSVARGDCRHTTAIINHIDTRRGIERMRFEHIMRFRWLKKDAEIN